MTLSALVPQALSGAVPDAAGSPLPVQKQAAQVTGITPLNPTTVEVHLADSRRLTLDFYGENIFRLFHDPAGGILRDPEAKPEAQILAGNPRRDVAPLVIDNGADAVSVSTSAVKVSFSVQTGLMQVTNLRTGNDVLEEARILLRRRRAERTFLPSRTRHRHREPEQLDRRWRCLTQPLLLEHRRLWPDVVHVQARYV